MYSITADELHDRVIDAMRSWFTRNRIPEPHVLAKPHARPLEQTVGSCLIAAHFAGWNADNRTLNPEPQERKTHETT